MVESRVQRNRLLAEYVAVGGGFQQLDFGQSAHGQARTGVNGCRPPTRADASVLLFQSCRPSLSQRKH
jgi:hypothetical protein